MNTIQESDYSNFKEVNWTDIYFSKWLKKQDENWTFNRIHNKTRYFCNNKMVATMDFKNINNFDRFKRIIKIRKDLL